MGHVKGMVAPIGQSGIKSLGKGVDIGGVLYGYEIKILGKMSDYRVYGNFDPKTKHIIFTLFGKGLH